MRGKWKDHVVFFTQNWTKALVHMQAMDFICWHRTVSSGGAMSFTWKVQKEVNFWARGQWGFSDQSNQISLDVHKCGGGDVFDSAHQEAYQTIGMHFTLLWSYWQTN